MDTTVPTQDPLFSSNIKTSGTACDACSMRFAANTYTVTTPHPDTWTPDTCLCPGCFVLIVRAWELMQRWSGSPTG